MRVLNVLHTVNPEAGGVAEGLRQMVPALHRMGHQHTTLSLDGPDDAWVRDFPGPIVAVGPSRSRYAYQTGLHGSLRSMAADHEALIVHGLWQYTGLAARRAARRAGRPYFVYPHGMLDPWFKRHYPLKHLKKLLYWTLAEHPVLHDATAVLFTTDEERLQASRSFARYSVREAVVGHGLSVDDACQRITSQPFRQRFGRSEGRRLMLFLGRLHEKKGCDLLIDAFARESAGEPDWMLVMAGPDGGGMRSALEQQAHTLGVADRVIWTGMLSGELKWSAFRAAEVFVLPSHQENFGMAVVEALAMGVPALVSQQVNIWREIVLDDAGFAADDNLAGTRALLRRWMRLTPGERQAMSKAARQSYEGRFSIDVAARRLADVLAQGVGLGQSQPARRPLESVSGL